MLGLVEQLFGVRKMLIIMRKYPAKHQHSRKSLIEWNRGNLSAVSFFNVHFSSTNYSASQFHGMDQLIDCTIINCFIQPHSIAATPNKCFVDVLLSSLSTKEFLRAVSEFWCVQQRHRAVERVYKTSIDFSIYLYYTHMWAKNNIHEVGREVWRTKKRV